MNDHEESPERVVIDASSVEDQVSYELDRIIENLFPDFELLDVPLLTIPW
jgi:hypothetical protein